MAESPHERSEASKLALGKEGLGFLVALIDALAAINAIHEIPSILVILVGLAAALIWLIWALLLRGGSNRLMKAFSIASVILAPCALVYFLLVGFVRVGCDRPSAFGDVGKRSVMARSIETPQPPATITGKLRVTFDEKADCASVVFAVVGEDRERVKELILTGVDRPAGNVQTQARTDPKEAGLIVQVITPASYVTADLEVFLEAGEPVRPVRVDVVSEYLDRGVWWRFKRWVFEHYP